MKVVRAAGGVIVRPAGHGDTLETLLVHQPRYDDWSIPKGKLLPGEREEDGALREVEEETGLRCKLGRELGTTSYRDSHGRPKTVRYWLLHPIGGTFVPDDEVDDVRWLELGPARDLLTYERDRLLLDTVAAEA